MTARFAIWVLLAALPGAACAVYLPDYATYVYCDGGVCATSGASASGSSGTSARSTSTAGTTGSSGGSTASGSGTSSGGSVTGGSSGSAGSSGSTGTGSSGGASSGSSSSGSTGTGTSSGTSGGSTSSGGSCTPGPTPARVLATVVEPNGRGSVWDLSNAASPFVAADPSGFLTSGDWPNAVAIASDGEILVLTNFDGLFAFDSCGKYLGAIEPLWENARYVPANGVGVAFLPQTSGAGVVVICDGFDGPVAFRYGGQADFDGGTLDEPPALWPSGPGSSYFLSQCFAGPGDTVYLAGENASSVQSLTPLDAITGAAAGAPAIATDLFLIYGGAIDQSGNLLAVGADRQGTFGAAELYDSNAMVTNAVTGAPTCIDLASCMGSNCSCQANSAPLQAAGPGGFAPALGQAAALPDGGFIAAYSEGIDEDTGSPYGTILQLQAGASGLTVTTYYSSDAGEPSFYGLASTPP